MQAFHIAARNADQLAFGCFARSHFPVGVEIGLLQQPVDSLFGLVRSIESNRCSCQGLSAADHHRSTPQGDQIAFQFFEFLLTGTDAAANAVEFGFRALDVRIAGGDVLTEAFTFGFELGQLLLKRSQFEAQGVGPLLRLLELNGDPFGFRLGLVPFPLGCLQLLTAVLEFLLQVIQFKQAHPQLPAHQKHQAK